MNDQPNGAHEARSLFASSTGHQPLGVWSAPGRINLIGEHTDYNDGLVLPFAIDRRTWCALGTRDDRQLRVVSTLASEPAAADLDSLDPAKLAGWSAYVLGVVWALGASGVDLSTRPGLDIVLASEVPLGAGLSSSAAIECAVAVAINDAWALGLSLERLASACQLAENEAVGAPTGIMDQTASLKGREGHAIMLDCRSGDTQSVPLLLGEAGLVAMTIDTNVTHAHATGGYADRRDACRRAAATLNVDSLRSVEIGDLPAAQAALDETTFRRVRHVVTENARVEQTARALETDGPRSIGPLLAASHASMRDDFEISVPELDLAVEVAVNHGAIGARMTGGGFGGSAIALVPAEAFDVVADAVRGAFTSAGFAQPTVFPVVPSGGARRDEPGHKSARRVKS